MKKITMVILLLFGLQAVGIGNAATLIKKATQSTFEFQAVKNDGTPLTGLTNITLFYSQHYSTGTFTALTSFGSPTEMAYGIYNATITAQMANCDYLVLIPTSSTTGFCQYPLKFKTTISDPANLATTDDGGTINVTAGAIDTVTTATTATNVTTVNGLAANVITAASINADAIGASELATDAVAEIAANSMFVGISTSTDNTNTKVEAYLDEAISGIDDNPWNNTLSGNEPTAAGYVISGSTKTASVDVASIFDYDISGYTFDEVKAGGYIVQSATRTIEGVGDWTSGEKEQIRDSLGVDGNKTAAVSGDIQDIYNQFTSTWTVARASKLDYLDTTISSRGTSTLTTSDNIGINWADVSNPTTVLGLTGTTIAAVTVSSFTATAQDSIGDNAWKYTLPGTYSGYQAGNLLYLIYIKPPQYW